MKASALVLALSLVAFDAAAQGIVLERIREPLVTPPPRGPLPIRLQEHRLRVRIVDQLAETDIEQVFHNPNHWEMEGVYLFPLPAGAAVSRFTMTMGGRVVEGEVLDAQRARDIYRSIVHERRDPGLLEFAGHGCLRASMFPIPARGETRVTLRFAQVLAPDGGLLELVSPMRFEGFQRVPVKVAGEIDVQSSAGVSAFFSPTHALDVARKSDTRVIGSFEDARYGGSSDFRLVYSLGKKDFGVSVATHRAAGEDGYFLMLLAPRVEFDAKDVMPKDIVFVLDTSGSMGERGGRKMQQAKAALSYALGRLDARDRFNVVAFSTEARPFRDALVDATKENVAAAVEHVQALVAAGGTAIHDALRQALALPRADGRVPIVVFLTDGAPTVGVTDPDAILRDAKATNAAGARLFVFGVGDDVNARLLTSLADGNRGAGSFVGESEEIEVKVSALVDKVASPVLAEARLSIDGLGEHDVFPRELGDLFKGQQASIVGRFRSPGARAITLTGRVGTREVRIVHEATFSEGAGNDFLPRLWAVRKVGFLLEEIRRNGESPELVDEIKRLGTRYGILTPYTSFLVVEERELQRVGFRLGGGGDAPATPAADPRERLEEARAALGPAAASPAPKAKRGAVEGAKIAKELKDADAGDALTGTGVKMVGTKTFRLEDGVWRDADLPATYTAKQVKYLSADYDALLDDTQLARYLSVGDRVIVQHGGVVYEIVVE